MPQKRAQMHHDVHQGTRCEKLARFQYNARLNVHTSVDEAVND